MIADWYFDFVSPFSYLQCERLQQHANIVRPHPVLFGAILDAIGQKGPAEIPAKRVFTYRFVVWRAKALGIPLRFPHAHPFNPLPLLRLAIACDSRFDAITRIFRFVWREGRVPDLPIEWAELAHDLGVQDAHARIADPEVKSALRDETDKAIARGVFGVPTLAIGSELFWGLDATDMALAYMRAGSRYDDPEYARVGNLPAAASREAVKGTIDPVRKRS
ncbi:MAG TPA: 2-hydroxychromene-2-carboxylate isomerase [Casimicrobiaceae bacterium]|nr:2-hydroxychromene-2-carboxylate isomerase [Casimicrobiaceae bacterium]